MSRRVYSLLVCIVVPFAFAVVLWRGLRDRGYREGWGERFGWVKRRGTGPCIWLHAVSLGEMSAAAPLVRALLARYPHIPLQLTTATPTGRARARALFADAVGISFLPYDTPGSVGRFLKRIQPRLAIIVETELWPNVFEQCARRGVPVVIASARLSAKSVASYRRWGGLFRGIFSANVSTAAQTDLDAERFVAIGAAAARTYVAGNIKFDVEVNHAAVAQGRQLRESLGAPRPVWVAGSTHAGEEEQVLDAHAVLRADQPNALLLLVPRHPDRFQAVADLLRERQVSFARRSGGAAPDAAASVLLVDSVGELAALYAAADVAFVGGSLVPVGGHNLLEPASLGLPVLTGPYHSNGKDIAASLLRQGAAWQVGNSDELAAALRRLFADPLEGRRMGEIGQAIVAANRGSVARLLAIIEPLVGAQPAAAASPAAGNR